MIVSLTVAFMLLLIFPKSLLGSRFPSCHTGDSNAYKKRFAAPEGGKTTMSCCVRNQMFQRRGAKRSQCFLRRLCNRDMMSLYFVGKQKRRLF